MMQGSVLIVDDDKGMCELIEVSLTNAGFHVTCRTDAGEALDLLEQNEFDAVVTDLNMRGINGIELCTRITGQQPDIPVVVITAFGSLQTAVAAIRAGAYDFVTKPFDMEELALILNRAVQYRLLRAEVRRLRREVSQLRRFHGLIGESPPMKKLCDLIGRISDSEASVVITGETGTGKEVVARALHDVSRRAGGPFVAVNCAALPEPLLESELFGHVKGAFTDAKTARKGLFVEAEGGTLFLDEIGAMPLTLQVKLLRALQERAVRPVGGDREQPVSVRIIAATNRDLEAAVEAGSFREDLLFRINVIPILVPPLRTRGNDILLLAQHFLGECTARAHKQVVGLTAEAAERLLAYAWPGNVRELQNCIERAVALTRYEQLTVDDLPERVREHAPSRAIVFGDDLSELVPMEEVERRYVLRVLEAVGGNKTMAAEVLGFDRKTLYRKLDRYLPQSEGARVRDHPME
jgi:DNA-binding NtrC family response regulator